MISLLKQNAFWFGLWRGRIDVTGFFARFHSLGKTGDTNQAPQVTEQSSSNAQNPEVVEPLLGQQGQGISDRYDSTANGTRSSMPIKPGQVSPQSASPGPSPQPLTPLYRKWYAWVAVTALAGLGGMGTAGFVAIRQIQSTLPNPQDALRYERDGSLTIKAADGSILQQLGPATREKLKIDEIPPLLVKAFVASEDKNFYQHGGVDYQAIARATLANVTAGEVVEGASTITQQVTRIVFLGQERTLDRKLREALLANKMEQELTKEQILERYLNLVYLGSGAYGVADAAWIYFSKSVDQLTLPEIAMIAGLAPAPSEFSPLVSLESATQRRDVVLGRMVEAGFITESEKAEAIAAAVNLKPSQPRNLDSGTPYFTSYIQQELPKYVSAEDMEVGGLTVETTLNPKLQTEAQKTITQGVDRYGRAQRFSQAALVSIDPRTGEIKAMVGGKEALAGQFNRATQAQRQPGSTFKAFVYTTAIAAGMSPYKSYLDSKFVVDGYEVKNYSPKHRGNLAMRDALINSINVVAVKVLIDAGFQPVMDMAKRMGIKSKLLPAYSLALGTLEVNLLELTSAYGTLAARGNHIEPHGIVKVSDRFGKVIYQSNFKAERAVDQDSADIMAWMLRGVVTSGTGGNAALRDRPVAGKTGTTDAKRDLWFVGFVPQMVTGVWLGNDNNRPTRGASSTAALLWRNFMAQATDGLPVERFPQPNLSSRRKASIKAQRVKPRKLVVGTTNDDLEENSSRSTRSESSAERRESAPVNSRPERASESPEPSPTKVRGALRQSPGLESPVAPPESSPEADAPRDSAPAPVESDSPSGTRPRVESAPAERPRVERSRPQPLPPPPVAAPPEPLPPPPEGGAGSP